MATGLPQYRPAVGGVVSGAVPALLPDPADDRIPGRGPAEGGRAHRGGRGPGLRHTAGEGTVLPGYDTVTVAVRHGLEAVDILRLRRACGAVLQSRSGSTVSFYVPAGTCDTWHLPGSACTPGALLLPPADPRWVMPPAAADGSTRPTDAWVLRSALCEAACTLTAGGLGPF
ncbi:hypothetical protein PUR71_23520 [Streptomyces sp. SP17BM10]|uniref:hypothetical protein n=1 Tax=Streptomyces sp. SP17BM10 TaxID=3002530 RepID=UPI002E790BDF|nr:hypothetical protein [Streptomyces sp. SP17BM10]MEE1785849.1 hypothetical protein [Streptomyces sp. SP17BM10]